MTTPYVAAAPQVFRLRDLYKLMERDYELLCKKDAVNLRVRWEKHLEPFFGNANVLEIKPDAIVRYAMDRKNLRLFPSACFRTGRKLRPGHPLSLKTQQRPALTFSHSGALS